MSNPHYGTNTAFFGVWGSSGNDVFAVGKNGAVEHYDGKEWTSMVGGLNQFGGTGNQMNGVWGISANDVYAADVYGTVLHYDGKTTWRVLTGKVIKGGGGTINQINGVWWIAGNDMAARELLPR